MILYKYLGLKVNNGIINFSTGDIIGTLVDVNFVNVQGEGYIPTFARTKLNNTTPNTFGFRTDMQIVSKKEMRKILSSTKKIKK